MELNRSEMLFPYEYPPIHTIQKLVYDLKARKMYSSKRPDVYMEKAQYLEFVPDYWLPCTTLTT